MRARPVRIDLVIPSIVERDAVSHHNPRGSEGLHSMGFVSEVYARNMGPGLQGRVHLLEELPREGPEHQWVCYQASIGSPAADVFASHPGLKLLDYHNISPAELVERWLPHLGEEVRLGRKQLSEMAPMRGAGLRGLGVQPPRTGRGRLSPEHGGAAHGGHDQFQLPARRATGRAFCDRACRWWA